MRFLAILLTFCAWAGENGDVPPVLEMNGIRFSDYADFPQWKMVTVRYRKDTNEQRFVYANKSAWETLEKKSIDYPDGAVFAKVGYIGEEDPEFTSSVVPSGARRLQLMVRDKKKYMDTGGWGYALFKNDGSFPIHPDQMTHACSACHQIVASSRGSVFSRPVDLSPFQTNVHDFKNKITNRMFREHHVSKIKPGIVFKADRVNSIKSTTVLRRLLPGRFNDIELVESGLSKSKFVGSFNEIIPSLVKETLATLRPAAMVGEKGLFSMVYPMSVKEAKAVDLSCQQGEAPVFIAMSAPPVYLPKGRRSSASNLEIRSLCIETKASAG